MGFVWRYTERTESHINLIIIIQSARLYKLVPENDATGILSNAQQNPKQNKKKPSFEVNDSVMFGGLCLKNKQGFQGRKS